MRQQKHLASSVTKQPTKLQLKTPAQKAAMSTSRNINWCWRNFVQPGNRRNGFRKQAAPAVGPTSEIKTAYNWRCIEQLHLGMMWSTVYNIITTEYVCCFTSNKSPTNSYHPISIRPYRQPTSEAPTSKPRIPSDETVDEPGSESTTELIYVHHVCK